MLVVHAERHREKHTGREREQVSLPVARAERHREKHSGRARAAQMPVRDIHVNIQVN